MIKKFYNWLMKDNTEHIGYIPREHPSVEEERIRDRQRHVEQLARYRERVRTTYSVDPPLYVTEIGGAWTYFNTINTTPIMRGLTEYEKFVCELYDIDIHTRLILDDRGTSASLSDCRFETEKSELITFWLKYQSRLKKQRSVGIFENEDFTI